MLCGQLTLLRTRAFMGAGLGLTPASWRAGVFGRLQTIAGVLIPPGATQLPQARLTIQSDQGNADLTALVMRRPLLQFPHLVL